MPVKSVQQDGSYQDIGVVRFNHSGSMHWDDPPNESPLRIPFGTKIKITITYCEQDFLNGRDGIVWATYDSLQAETIRDALLVQQISSETHPLRMDDWLLYTIRVPYPEEAEQAIDFIWRASDGMRLQPDWWFPANTQNPSFQKWLNGG